MDIVIEIMPFDTLFFGSGRRFERGSYVNWSESILPLPSTFYGAIKMAIINQRAGLRAAQNPGFKFDKDLGDPGGYGTMEIKGPVIKKEKDYYFPVPLDLYQKEKVEKVFYFAEIEKISKWFETEESIKEKYTGVFKGREWIKEPVGFISKENLVNYLNLEGDEIDVKKLEEFYEKEPKIGIARDVETLTAKEGMLYRIEYIRLKENTKYVVKIEGLEKFENNKGFLKLGGESKACFYKVIEVIDKDIFKELDECVQFEGDEEYFKLYFITPGIFEKGWSSEESRFMKSLREKGMEIQFIGGVIGKPINVPRLRLKAGRVHSSAIYKAIPAGSVLYFKIKRGNISDIKKELNLRCISDKFEKEGFGLCLMGKIKMK